MSIILYIGGQSSTIQREKQDLGGYRCFTAAYPKNYPETSSAIGLLDSGAFSDPLDRRLTPELALMRQIRWEESASRKLRVSWISYAIASYDLLIDEIWTGNCRVKCRPNVTDAERAINITVAAAKYLSSQRHYLKPRHLILGCQGVDAQQYYRCVARVLEHTASNDWIGLGGWCILGRFTSWLPVFHEVLHQCIPLIAQSPVRHVHIYGVLWEKALAPSINLSKSTEPCFKDLSTTADNTDDEGSVDLASFVVPPLLWMADSYRLTVSADSKRPISDCTRSDAKKAGLRHPYWRDNVKWWQDYLAAMRTSKFYREPGRMHKQLQLFDLAITS